MKKDRLFILVLLLFIFCNSGVSRSETRELEGEWLFDAQKTSTQLITSSNNEEHQKKLQTKLEMWYGNTCINIRVIDETHAEFSFYNRYDGPNEQNTYSTQLEYNDYRLYYTDQKGNLLALREGLLAFQPRDSELSQLYRKIK